MKRYKRKYAIALLLIMLLLFYATLCSNRYLRNATDVADHFCEVDRIVVSLENGEVYSVTDDSELTVYKAILEPKTIYSGDHEAIKDAIIRKTAEVSFYIGEVELVREELYLLDEDSGIEWGRHTEGGYLIGKVDGKFRRLGS